MYIFRIPAKFLLLLHLEDRPFGVSRSKDSCPGSTNANQPGIVYNLSLCSFFNLGVGLSYGSVQGVTVSQCNFTNVITGIWSPAGNTNGSQLAVVASQFGVGANQILTQSPIGQIMLAANLFIAEPAGNAVALWTPNGIQIIGANGTYQNANAILAGNTFVKL